MCCAAGYCCPSTTVGQPSTYCPSSGSSMTMTSGTSGIGGVCPLGGTSN
jgi:hypothetical protein